MMIEDNSSAVIVCCGMIEFTGSLTDLTLSGPLFVFAAGTGCKIHGFLSKSLSSTFCEQNGSKRYIIYSDTSSLWRIRSGVGSIKSSYSWHKHVIRMSYVICMSYLFLSYVKRVGIPVINLFSLAGEKIIGIMFEKEDEYRYWHR